MHKVNVNLTVDNPYQPPDRHAGAEHQQYIQEELCPKILQHAQSRPETLGLLQLPAGRIVDAHGDPVPRETVEAELPFDGELTNWLRERDYLVQLAWGHGRRDAFAWLSARQDSAYEVLPIEIVYFTAEEMATSAWTENQARSDLTPLQRLYMLERMMQDFEWNQSEVARRLELSAPVVSNTLRLRKLEKLPDLQEALEERKISERQAVALLPLAEMPVEILNERTRNVSWLVGPEKLVAKAASGVSSEDLRKDLGDLVHWRSKELDPGEFDPEEDYEGPAMDFLEDTEALRHSTCDGCEARFTYDKTDRCADEGCWEVKQGLHQHVTLARASEASGIQVKDMYSDYVRTHFYGQPHNRMLHPDEGYGTEGILAEGCENLRLYWYRNPGPGEALDLESFPMVVVGCLEGRCACAARMLEKMSQTDPELLRDAAEEHNNEWRLKREALARLEDPVKEVLACELEAQNPKAWISLENVETLEEVWEYFANRLVRRALDWNASEYLEKAREDLVKLCEEIGVDPAVVPLLEEDPALEFEEEEEEEEEEPAPAEPVEESMDLLDNLHARYGRIASWITETNGDAKPEQIRGNISNLEKIKGELVQLNGGDGSEAESLRHLVVDTIQQLNMMQGG